MRGAGLFLAILLSAQPAVALAVSDTSKHSWMLHANARFGTRAEYPADLFAQGRESDNGDGKRWTARDGATLAVYGTWNTLGHAPASYAEFLKRSDGARYSRLAYRVVRPRLLILSGTAGNRVFYERYAFGDRSGAIHAMVIDYPASRRAVYAPVIERISRSLAWYRPAR